MWMPATELCQLQADNTAQNLRGTFVNIVDSVNACENGTSIKIWTSAKALANYTWSSGKIFPLKRAKEHHILNWMLIELR